jgi:hypothetical protein
LEYAAFLYERSIEWLDDIVRKKKGVSITQFFEKEADWDREKFEQNLRDNFKLGTFKLFIVVDEVSPDLQRTINFMNDALRVKIYALELRHFKEKSGIQILVPNVHGGKKRIVSISPPVWTEEKSFEDVAKKVDAVTFGTIQKLYSFSKQLGSVDFGSGRTTGTFRVSLPYKGEQIRFYIISPSPSWSYFTFKSMAQKGISKTQSLEYVRRLKSLGFQLDETKHVDADGPLDVTLLNDEGKFAAFKEYSAEFKRNIS